MEDLEFYKKWCLAHLKFDKENHYCPDKIQDM